ncbi:MAG: hypothetical protein HYT65_00270 [Candidatus Yanofskybacteria bacterium]|nr:hypothetical protein [Candidatus Yanofskybacteria bacterium]
MEQKPKNELEAESDGKKELMGALKEIGILPFNILLGIGEMPVKLLENMADKFIEVAEKLKKIRAKQKGESLK